MVECIINLDNVFSSLSDATRRDILKRVSKCELSISELAKPYKISFAAIAKHISVLEKANLVIKKREGKEQMVSLVPAAVNVATLHLKQYEKMWNDRFDALDAVLKN